ncbi:MAG: hypothetical protein SFT93_03530, partial [Rickettsiaceae bacterium]|nr:hypothetical protein [Rickettsiaceae bacterium]
TMMNNQEEIEETEEKEKNSLSTQNQSKEQLQIAQDNSNPLTMISSLSNAQTTKEQAQILLDQADELYFYQGKTEESIILYDRVINEVINSQNNNTSHGRSVRIWDDAERTFATLESSIEPLLLKIRRSNRIM